MVNGIYKNFVAQFNLKEIKTRQIIVDAIWNEK